MTDNEPQEAKLSRRDFIKIGLAGAVGAASGHWLVGEFSDRYLENVDSGVDSKRGDITEKPKIELPVLKSDKLTGNRTNIPGDVIARKYTAEGEEDLVNNVGDLVTITKIEQEGGVDPTIQVEINPSMFVGSNFLEFQTGRKYEPDRSEAIAYSSPYYADDYFVSKTLIEGESGKVTLFFGTDSELENNYSNYILLDGNGDFDEVNFRFWQQDRTFVDDQNGGITVSTSSDNKAILSIGNIDTRMRGYDDNPGIPDGGSPFKDSTKNVAA